jgi:hypothetical protein
LPTPNLLAAARNLRGLIEAEAEQIEAGLGFTPPVVDGLTEAGLFKLILPKDLGGHEADIGTILEVCAEIAYADGSVGWAFSQNTTVAGYLAYLEPEHARPFAEMRAGAGMFAPNGVAHKDILVHVVAGFLRCEDGDGLQAELATADGGGERVVGAGRAVGDDALAPFGQRLAKQEFELADLVSAVDRTAEVVLFHEYTIANCG